MLICMDGILTNLGQIESEILFYSLNTGLSEDGVTDRESLLTQVGLVLDYSQLHDR